MTANIVPAPKLVRFSVYLNQETAAALKVLAQRHSTSITEAVRRSISVHKFIRSESRQGRKVHTLDADGTNVRELVFHA